MTDREITSFDLDILGEIGNIGGGNAATALSQILNKPVYLEVPMKKLCNLTDVSDVLGGSEEFRTGVFFQISEFLDGYVMFILDNNDTERICNIVSGGYQVDPNSVISEIANIISGAYIGALASMLDKKIDLSPPAIGQDMLGSLVDGIISNLCSVGNQTVIIGTKLVIGDETFSGFYVLMLESHSLNKLLDHFKLN